MTVAAAAEQRPLGPAHGLLVLGAVLALVLAVLCTWLRVHAALHDPNFDSVHPEGMLKSDPALLYYFVERILESGGWLPADFGAEPRLLYPAATDVLAHFPMGYELVVAWSYRWLGGGMPLHVFCVYVASVCASATLLGVYGLALELTRRVGSALLAAALWAGMIANYRTVGFILVGEDFSLPWLALHLYLLARARRLRTPASIAWCAAALVVALATWHASGFFVALEALVVYAWFLASGENPLAVRRAWIFPALVLAATAVVPILRATRAWASAPVLVLLALWISAVAAQRLRWTRRGAVAAGIGGAGLVAGLAFALGGGQGEYSHVFGLVWHKLVNVGELPADPRELPAEVRLMWQGPFATSSVRELALGLGLPAIPCLVLLQRGWRSWRARSPAANGAESAAALIAALLALGVAASWLIERTLVLPGMLVPVAAVLAIQGWSARVGRLAALALLVIAGFQGVWVVRHFARYASGWYYPPERQTELRALIEALPGLVPDGEPIATDFVNSTAILAHTRHPMLLQPKYEDRESRERAVEFFTTFYQSTPAQMVELMQRYRCRYLVVDRFVLDNDRLQASRYVGGLRYGAAPVPGTCWDVLASSDAATLRAVASLELVYRSPASLRAVDGRPSDHYRVFVLRR